MSAWKWDEERQAWRKELWLSGQRTKLTCHGTKKDAEAHEARKRIEMGATGVVREKDAPAFSALTSTRRTGRRTFAERRGRCARISSRT